MADTTKKKKILVIEDDASLGTALCDRFQESGFEALLSVDGETGLRMAEDKKPDLILLDIILPRKNGFQFMEEIKQKTELASIPIVALTNLESSFDIEHALSLGARAYLVKTNYSLSEVVRKIQQILA